MVMPAMPRDPSVLSPGYTPVPAGHLASVVTYLEMRARPPQRAVPVPAGAPTLHRLGAADLDRYRALYREVGERWLWFSRLVMPAAELQAILADPAVQAYAVHAGDTAVGLLELDFRTAGEAELAFFGVTDAHVGTGLGRWLMEQALTLAWAQPITRLHVHTCTLDHPAAVPFYERSGFTAYARAVEVAPDPRLSGALPREAALRVPRIG
jgi:GNAT superfamily N-acetyltransferase